ncbi:hypothetical protein [Desulfosarcina sp.]|uniref:hypothetical protein n=1 Tax=Desulfosarcina sp. TaxID=2027861 RepID=UPI003563E62F
MRIGLLIPVVLLVGLGLAACATRARKQWVHLERSAAEMTLDRSTCELQAETGARNMLGAIEENKKAKLFRQCMQDRGYRLEALETQP